MLRSPDGQSASPVIADDLPEWDLSDLYPGMDSPAVEQDFRTAERAAMAFKERYEGRWPS